MYSLFSIIGEMSNFLVSVKRYIKKLGSAHKNDKNLKAEEDDLINDEEAVRSIYHLFKLSRS